MARTADRPHVPRIGEWVSAPSPHIMMGFGIHPRELCPLAVSKHELASIPPPRHAWSVVRGGHRSPRGGEDHPVSAVGLLFIPRRAAAIFRMHSRRSEPPPPPTPPEPPPAPSRRGIGSRMMIDDDDDDGWGIFVDDDDDYYWVGGDWGEVCGIRRPTTDFRLS